MLLSQGAQNCCGSVSIGVYGFHFESAFRWFQTNPAARALCALALFPQAGAARAIHCSLTARGCSHAHALAPPSDTAWSNRRLADNGCIDLVRPRCRSPHRSPYSDRLPSISSRSSRCTLLQASFDKREPQCCRFRELCCCIMLVPLNSGPNQRLEGLSVGVHVNLCTSGP